jgi:PQQ-dependent dehydrogenase (methanol/ethanol family)
MKTRFVVVAAVGVALFTRCPADEVTDKVRRAATAIGDERLREAGKSPDDWITHGLDYAETRFSRLDQINSGNVNKLGLAWSLDLGTRRGIEATPIVVGGYMFLTGPWSVVYALNARTGRKIWEWDPQVDKATYADRACCDVVNRGVALYKSRIYVGVLDGRLAALDAATGQPVWQAKTVDPTKPYTITGAPRVYDGKVIIGNGGAEYGVRGYVSAYNAETGILAWRTYTVPGDPAQGFESPAMESAANTWTGEWWKHGGGGTCWNSFAYDNELGLVFVGTGNGSPWNRLHRSPGGGDNLYLSSMLALRIADGSYVWHYQTTPGDTWDFTATEHMILADMEIAGRLRKLIMQAPKNGFFYVLDRTTGEFISAKPYASVTWAAEIDQKTGRPIETPGSRYETEPKAVRPMLEGAHNWQPMAYHPDTGLVYFPVMERQLVYGHDPKWQHAERGHNTGLQILGDAGFKRTGHLTAWDPRTQKEVWRANHVHFHNGGVLATAGNLVWEGTGDGRFVAYDARSGKILWERFVGLGILAPPVTYRVDGKQYIAVAAGWGGVPGASSGGPGGAASRHEQIGRVFAFTLDGRDDISLPPSRVLRKPVGHEIPLTISTEQIAQGQKLFNLNCARCHNERFPNNPGILPDLRLSAKETLTFLFSSIVRDGIYAKAKGMPSFKDMLSDEEVEYIRAYIISASRKLAGPER